MNRGARPHPPADPTRYAETPVPASLLLILGSRHRDGSAGGDLRPPGTHPFPPATLGLTARFHERQSWPDLREESQRLALVYERKHAALEALKKSLLHQAFTGEL